MSNKTTTKSSRLARRIQAALAGRASRQVTVRATLTGPAADAWSELRLDGEGLGMGDQALLAALLDAGASSLRRALREISQ